MVGGKISVFTGEDGVFLPFLSLGGQGIVSVAANIVAREYLDLYADWKKWENQGSQRKIFRT